MEDAFSTISKGIKEGTFAPMHARYNPPWNIVDNRLEYFQDSGNICFLMQNAIEYALSRENKSKLRTNSDGEAVVVDLASGAAAFVVAYALYFSKPRFPVNVSWIATDYDGTDSFTRETIPSLQLFNKDTAPQFADKNGCAVYFGDSVRLHSLSKEEFNGLHGMLHRKDAKSEGRYEVFIARGSKMGSPLSIKPANIERNSKGMGDVDVRSMAEALAWNERPNILKGLLDRATLLDIKDLATWANLTHVEGNCTIVTCSHLMRMIGMRVPDAWQFCMRIASKLLQAGGAFIAFDAIVGTYGNASIMKQFESANNLGMKLVDPLPKKIMKKARQVSGHKLMIWIKQ